MRRQTAAVVAALLFVAQPTTGEAAPSKANVAKARALFKRASLDYKLSKFKRALAGYEQAYALAPRPSALFNIANCYRHLADTAAQDQVVKKLKKAIFYYKLFVDEWTARHPTRQVPQLDAARAHVKALQARLAARPKPKPAPKPSPRPTSGPATQPTTRAVPLVPVATGPTTTTTAKTAATASSPFYRTWWFWTIVGVAAAGGATAAVIGATSGTDSRVPGGHSIDWSLGQ